MKSRKNLHILRIARFVDVTVQTDFRVSPVAVGSWSGNSQHGGGLLVGKTGKKPQFHQIGFDGIFRCKLVEGLVERQQVLHRCRCQGVGLLKIDTVHFTTAFLALPSTSAFNKDSTHRLGSRSKEVTAPVPRLGICDVDKPKVRFVDEAGCLQRLTWFFPSEAGLRQFSEEYVDEIIEETYTQILQIEETRTLFSDQAAIERVKALQKRYLLRLTSGDYGEEYLADRLQIGITHQRIGLEPRWYMGAYFCFRQALRLFAVKRRLI